MMNFSKKFKADKIETTREIRILDAETKTKGSRREEWESAKRAKTQSADPCGF